MKNIFSTMLIPAAKRHLLACVVVRWVYGHAVEK